MGLKLRKLQMYVWPSQPAVHVCVVFARLEKQTLARNLILKSFAQSGIPFM